jgi:predicted nucleic acid-binding protein
VNGYLLDTNILSELRKGPSADAGVRGWARAHARERHFISVLSLGEIRKGIEILRRRSPGQCEAFESWLEGIRTTFSETVLELDAGILDEWGCLMATRTFPAMDGLIAATARYHGLTIATRNTADFREARVAVVNPFAFPFK